ncbi:unnamed protein product [Orchesella dallaii]|uniref:Uncharacterized protein n=1 Tax=Orchesella dallaii TaxID=48710 RepID=A0ABP1QDL8_9HEXA
MCSINVWEVDNDSTSRDRGTTNAIAISDVSPGTNFSSNSSHLLEDQSALCTVVRERIKAVLYHKAVDFRAEVRNEMNDVRIKLKMALNEAKSAANLLIQDQEVKDVAIEYGDYDAIAGTVNCQKEQLVNVYRLLAEVEDYEKKFAELKDKWENFRTNFKGKAIEIINRELEKQRQNSKPEDILDWTYFMPEIIVNDNGYGTSAAAPGSTRVVVKYFE